MAKKDDAVKAQRRFIDQPGQWRDTTPKDLKARQDKAWKDFAANQEKYKKKSTKK